MADKKLDKPSEHDFLKGITDNIPNDEDLFKAVAKGYALATVLGYGSKSKRKS